MKKTAAKDDDVVVVICERITSPLMLPDNRIGKCMGCGWKVQFRPHAPVGRRMCRQCGIDLIESDPKIEIVTTPRMLEDLAAYLKGRSN